MAARKTAARRRASDVRDDDDENGMEGGEPRATSVTQEVSGQVATALKEREPQAIISRVDDRTGNDVHLDTIDAGSVVNEEWVANTYGGGKYRVKFRGLVDGKWQYIPGTHQTFTIDHELPFKGSIKAQRLREDREREEGGRAFMRELDDMPRPQPSAIGNVIESGVLTIMRDQAQGQQMMMQHFMTMNEQSRANAQAHQQMMMEMMKEMRGSRTDWVAILGIVTPLLPQFIQMLKPKDAIGAQELIAIMERAKPKDEGAKLQDALDLMQKIREVTENMGGGDGDGGGTMGVLARVAEKVLPMLAAQVAQQPAPRASAVVTPVPFATPPVASPGASGALPPSPASSLGNVDFTTMTGEQVWQLLAEQEPRLLMLARMGIKPDTAANMVLDVLTPPQEAVLVELLADPQFDAVLLERLPSLAERAKWVGEFLQELRDALFASDDDTVDGGAGTGAGSGASPTS